MKKNFKSKVTKKHRNIQRAELKIKDTQTLKRLCICFPESLADRNEHAAGRAGLRHVWVQDSAAAAADADGSSWLVSAGQYVRQGGTKLSF